jgi:peptidoglycan/LPS O-acetylase OafA/YrhL
LKPLNSSTAAIETYRINWPLLGVIRFFLAFIVLTEHLGWFISSSDVMLKFSKFSPLVAVLGFLVISGYSIAASFEAKQKGFYVRRALRIYPVYVLSIIFASMVVLYFPEKSAIVNEHLAEPNIKILLGNLFFMQGFLVNSLESNPIVWTLSIEIFFYILAPLLEAKNRYFIYFILASALLFSCQRYIGFYYFSQMLYGLNVAFLGWAWLIGYWYYHHRNNSNSIFFLCSLGVISITINGFFVSDFWTITWIITCTALGYGHLLINPFPLLSKILGDISYPMYLLHIPIFAAIKSFDFMVYGFFYFMAALLLCFFIDAFVDKPFKRLIKMTLLRLS